MIIRISVFTPTYNRKDTLKLTYESLKNQSFKDFEWIIIDDGSTDYTSVLVKEWIEENIIDIKYYYQKNLGKHIAQNRALDYAEGELFLPLDSDDTIVSNCLQRLWDVWCEIPGEEKKEYSGVGCCCMDGDCNLIGDPFPDDKLISNDLEIVFKYRVKGEKWGAIRTDIMRCYKNPEVKGHYLAESTVWFRIAKKYKKIYINDMLRIYEIHTDSVQKKKRFTNEDNAEAKMVSSKILINEFWKWYRKYNLGWGITQCLVLTKATIESGNSIVELIKDLHPIIPRFVVLFASPYKLLYLVIQWKRKN